MARSWYLDNTFKILIITSCIAPLYILISILHPNLQHEGRMFRFGFNIGSTTPKPRVITLDYVHIAVKTSIRHYQTRLPLAKDQTIENAKKIVPYHTTKSPKSTTLDDVYIAVKTSKRNHNGRMSFILKTWFQLAKKQTWFFTDVDDEKFQNLTDGHMINTKCGKSHSRRDLCCKMGVEINTFMTASESKWFCHFDDDNYINIPKLVDVLNGYDPNGDWYLGKPSLNHQFTVTHQKTKKKIKFWFGTGGAGICISRPLVTKMKPVTIGDQFMLTCDTVGQGDDVTVGYIFDQLLNISLTVIDKFHSHYEKFKSIPRETIEEEIVLSYKGNNILEIDGFDLKTDPTRFMSLHCILFPNADLCSTMKKTYRYYSK